MDAFVTALGTSLTPADLWGAVAPVVPVVGIAVIFALGIYFARRVVSGIGKGKAKI